MQIFKHASAQVRRTVRNSGLKGVDYGLKCGFGIGYGLGAGFVQKPSTARALQNSLIVVKGKPLHIGRLLIAH